MGQPQATREQLIAARTELESAARSPAYSPQLRERAARLAEAVSARLRDGDMRLGDRLVLRVEGQESLSDTFSVAPGRRLELPGLRVIELTGVLRSELEPRLTASIREVYRAADVKVHALILVGVLGEVIRPGYYHVRPDALLEEVIMAAGGFANQASARFAIERGDSVVVREQDADQALRAGRSLGALSVASGDMVRVQRRASGDFTRIVTTATMALSLPAAIFTALAIFQ